MVRVDLKGVHAVTAKGRTYHYAWRGGPRLQGEPGSPEYVASYNVALAARKAPAKGTLREILTAYKASPKYAKLGAHTRRAYDAHLKAIDAEWATLPFVALNDPAVRRLFLQWRDSMADRPRTADMAVGVLKTVLGWAVENVYLAHNQAEPISRLHRVDKSDDIWTPEDIEAFAAVASKELRWAVELALHTGLRQSDLIGLTWFGVQGDAIVCKTSKRGKQVLIPITPALRALLERIERRGGTILTTQRGKAQWTADGLRSSFGKACDSADPKVSRTFHDLRRTAATNLLCAGLDASQVAMIMGWSEKEIEALKRRYVSRAAVVQAVLAKLQNAL
jgi:integrase